MKSKKIIASVAAMSVFAMSTMSFAEIIIKDSNITTLTNKAVGTTISATGKTKIANIVADQNMTLKGDADLSSTAVVAKKDASVKLQGITVGSTAGEGTVTPDVKQKCETLLYKQVA